MSEDIKLFNLCNHVVNNEQYEIDFCPRCEGHGYYYDICFNNIDNTAITCTGSIKFQQEILKILIDKINSNKFHPEWGTGVNELIGSKNLKTTQIRLQILIRKTLEYLQKLQKENASIYNNMPDDEIINNIMNVEVISFSETGYLVKVTLSDTLGNTFIQELELG